MDVSFSHTENYPIGEETIQSLYADEQPKRRVKPNMELSKLAETVGIENNIMLNPEELAKVTARNIKEERDFNKNFGMHTRHAGTFANPRQRSVRRQPFDTTEMNDIANSPSLPETRTSVIRGIASSRRQHTMPENETASEADRDASELHCHEQFEKDTVDSIGRNRHYIQNSVVDTYTAQSDNKGHVSENISRTPISSNRPFPMETRSTSQPYFAQQIRDPAYRVQHHPEFKVTQMDARGKQFFERGAIVQPGSAISYGVLNQAYKMQDGIYVESHTDVQGYPRFSKYERRSPQTNENIAKNNNSLPLEHEPLKSTAKSNPAIRKINEEEQPTRQNSMERDMVHPGKSNEHVDVKQLDDNRNIKGKRNTTTKADSNIQCPQCLKKFGSSSALAKHKATHSDERKYICPICEKGFKRQDHLNGHKMTHRDKKPYECKYCDKSYCDHRSLKRHYENCHPNANRSQPVTTTLHKTDSEIIRTARQDGRFTPDGDDAHHPSPLRSKQELPHTGFGRKRNSDSMCSNSSDDLSRRPDSHSPHVLFDKNHTAVSMLKQVIDSKEHKEKHPMEGFPRSGYYPYPEGYNSQQWYNPYQAQMLKLMQPPILVPHGIPPMTYCDPPQLVPSYPPVSQHHVSECTHEDSNGRRGDDSGSTGNKDFVVPTDPTSIAIANAKERDRDDQSKQTQFKNSNAGRFPHAVQWKTITVGNEKASMPPRSMVNNPAAMQVQANMMVPDNTVKHERPGELNIHIPSSQGEKRPHDMVTTTEHQPKRHRPPPPSPASLNMAKEGLLKLADISIKSEQPSSHDNIFKNPPSTPPRKPRHRPEPINISCSNLQYTGSLSPPIYTPPPMLSPLSIFHTPRIVTTPITPSRFFQLGNRSRKNSIEEADGTETTGEIIMPEPKINIGPGFQAEVPETTDFRQDPVHDKHRAAVCWIPFEHETRKRSSEIEAFLDMACSVAVFGGGSNKEYALHVLYRLKGNIKLAVKHILATKSAIQKEDGLADYHYEGSEKWSSKERLKFREALDKCGKNFYEISKEIKTKSTQQCVEFYYLWKACRPEGMRSRRGYAEETDSEKEIEGDDSDNDSETTFIFECDFPECNSKFISRQALNGHIRVHGGSFMKPEPKRAKIRTTANADSSGSSVSATTNVSRAVSKPTKSKPPAPPVPNGDGTLPEFPCKVCGRIFNKIKSRSAHMKTHVKRNDDEIVKSKS